MQRSGRREIGIPPLSVVPLAREGLRLREITGFERHPSSERGITITAITIPGDYGDYGGLRGLRENFLYCECVKRG